MANLFPDDGNNVLIRVCLQITLSLMPKDCKIFAHPFHAHVLPTLTKHSLQSPLSKPDKKHTTRRKLFLGLG